MVEQQFKKNIITQLSDREHLLKRPGMYIGSIKPETTQSYFYNTKNNKFEYTTYEFIPGLVKIIMEIIDNSLDEGKRTNYSFANTISVDITNKSVCVVDNGRGVPLDIDPNTKLSMAELAFTHPKAGANFDDTDRQTIGLNGVGSFCTNVWSKIFNVDTCDGKKNGSLRCINNMEQHTFDIKKGLKRLQGTKVYFEPDLERFGIDKIDDIHKSVVYQRLLFLAITYPQIKFNYNKKDIIFKSGKTLLESFDDNYAIVESDNYLIGVIPNNTDDFLQVSYINGLDVKKGGNHIDYINSEIVSRLKDKLLKRYKEIKPGDIKNKLQYIVIFKNFNNPEFNSQTKEQLTNSPSDIKQFLSGVDWDKFTNTIYKKDAIIDPIIETYKIKEELKLRQSLKSVTKRTRDFKSDKYLPAVGKKVYLLVCEGDSAAGGCSSAFGRNEKGYYASKGVPINGYTASIQKFTNNGEFNDIIKILNLQLNGQAQQLDYKYVVLANDADFDGSHIKMLYIGIFMKYAPQVIKDGQIKQLKTPIVVLKDKKTEQIKEYFFTFDEYNTWIEKHDVNKYLVDYKKGLGSWNDKEWEYLLSKHDFNYFLDTVTWDDKCVKTVDDWLGSDNSDVRKNMLKQYEFTWLKV